MAQSNVSRMHEQHTPSPFDAVLTAGSGGTLGDQLAALNGYEILDIERFNVIVRKYVAGSNGLTAADALVANRGFRSKIKADGAKYLESAEVKDQPESVQHAMLQTWVSSYVPTQGRDTNPPTLSDVVDAYTRAVCEAQAPGKLAQAAPDVADAFIAKQSARILATEGETATRHASGIFNTFRKMLEVRNAPSTRGRKAADKSVGDLLEIDLDG